MDSTGPNAHWQQLPIVFTAVLDNCWTKSAVYSLLLPPFATLIAGSTPILAQLAKASHAYMLGIPFKVLMMNIGAAGSGNYRFHVVITSKHARLIMVVHTPVLLAQVTRI